MNKNQNLVEKISTYSFSMTELHKKLGIAGKYVGSGFYEGRSAEDIEKGISPDTNKYYIETKKPVMTHPGKDMTIKKGIAYEYKFAARLLKKRLGLEGFIESFDMKENKYIITTTNKKNK